jgi:hypothetical protein
MWWKSNRRSEHIHGREVQTGETLEEKGSMETRPQSRVGLVDGGAIGGGVDGAVFVVEHGLSGHGVGEQGGR